MNISFNYDDLLRAKDDVEEIDSWWKGIGKYQDQLSDGLNGEIRNISGTNPYGNSYVSDAKGNVTDKVKELVEKESEWKTLATNIGSFIDYMESTEKEVVDLFQTMASPYVNYSGIGGFFQGIGDSLYNFYAVDIANSNALTRFIGNMEKTKDDYYAAAWRDTKDYFQHGDGKYILNIVGSIAGATLAVVGTVAAIVAIPFTGGTSAAIALGIITAGASAIATGITAYNTYIHVDHNLKAMKQDENPGMARVNSNTKSLTDFAARTNLGSKEANERLESAGKFLDYTKTACEVVSAVGGSAQTLGSAKNANIVGAVDGTALDFSGANMKKNFLKTFGIENLTVSHSQNPNNIDIVQSVYPKNETIGVIDNLDDINYISGTRIKSNQVGIEILDSEEIVDGTLKRRFVANTVSKQSDYKSITIDTNNRTYFGSRLEQSEAFSSTSFYYDKMMEPVNNASKFKSATAKENMKKWFNLTDDQASKVGEVVFKGTDKLHEADTLIKISQGEPMGKTLFNHWFSGKKVGKAIDKYIITEDSFSITDGKDVPVLGGSNMAKYITAKEAMFGWEKSMLEVVLP